MTYLIGHRGYESLVVGDNDDTTIPYFQRQHQCVQPLFEINMSHKQRILMSEYGTSISK